jgi:hypothetical protein
MTTVVKNTNIPELLKVSAGNFAVVASMGEEFSRMAQASPGVIAAAASASVAPAPVAPAAAASSSEKPKTTIP